MQKPGTPRLSVIVPVYDVEQHLTECLDSIFGYPGGDLEVVAVDDASPDGSGAMLDAYARREPRLSVVHLADNRGLGGARNAGLDHVTGEYVWFVDSDDWLPEGSVAAVIDRLAAYRADLLVIEHADVYPGAAPARRPAGAALDGAAPPVRLAAHPKLLRLTQSSCTKIARRTLIADSGLRFRPGWYEDCSFSHPLLLAAGTVDVLERVCYFYRQQTGGITSTLSDRHFEVFDQYQALWEFVDGGDYGRFRPELFRLMINHYLVILGNEWRLSQGSRRAFFGRVVADYRRRLPPEGYDVPGGVEGLKHRLVRANAWPLYAGLRWVYRVVGRLRGRHQGTPTSAPAAPSSTAA
ncbi:MAG: glycosyltransferase family 2 protein [Micromonosporaceae bacterium]